MYVSLSLRKTASIANKNHVTLRYDTQAEHMVVDINKIMHAESLETLESLRLYYFGKTGVITEKLKALGNLSPEEKKTQGALINSDKENLQSAIQIRKKELELAVLNEQLRTQGCDITLSARSCQTGSRHPISKTLETIRTYFHAQGFIVKDGPEVEDDFHNFDALNIPKHHPARQNHDTFFLKTSPFLLRTHTSNVQIRTMEKEKPPYRILSLGKVYRSDHDATHSPMFHQIEGLVIEKGIHMGHLKGCLTDFCRYFFDIDNLPLRFRPSFFPFTEPSAEVDIQFNKKTGKIGDGTDWLEVLGCGMVHPNVIKNCGLDPYEHSGFAFGMGAERFAMLRYNIADLRSFFINDTRFLQHYSS